MPNPVKIVDLEISQGSQYVHVFNYVDSDGEVVDLTNYTARMQIRDSHQATDKLYDSTTLDDIDIVGATGKITLSIPTSVTTDFTFKRGVYDIEIVDPTDEVTRIVEGSVEISPEVTR